MNKSEARADATHASIKESAGVMRAGVAAQTDSADRRTELAADRTVLAAERTYAAWVRTGLSALAAGVGARALLKGVVPEWMSLTTAVLLVLFSAFCYLAAVWRELFPEKWKPKHDIRRLPAPVLIAVNGFLVVVSAAAIVGIVTVY